MRDYSNWFWESDIKKTQIVIMWPQINCGLIQWQLVGCLFLFLLCFRLIFSLQVSECVCSCIILCLNKGFYVFFLAFFLCCCVQSVDACLFTLFVFDKVFYLSRPVGQMNQIIHQTAHNEGDKSIMVDYFFEKVN